MESIKAVLLTSKTSKNGVHPIILRIIKDRKTKYTSIGYSCTKELWDDKKSLPRRKHPLSKELTIVIEKKINDAKTSLLNLENEKGNFSTEELKNKILRIIKKTTLFQYLGLIVKKLCDTDRVSYARSHKDLIRELRKFTKGKDLIETLWRKMKYSWLKPHHYASLDTLTDAVEEIISDIGEKLKIEFSELKYFTKHKLAIN